MKGVPFRHIGGMIVTDHGPFSLRRARATAVFYARECARALRAGDRPTAVVCARRARALLDAVGEARRWRRAAGWSDPEAADTAARPSTTRPRDKS